MRSLLRVWRKNGFTLRIFDTESTYRMGDSHPRLAYELKDGRRVIFQGADFGASPLYAVDSLETVCALLRFLSLQPGDTDREYFDSYTPEQLAWARSDRCAELGHIRYELEQGRG